MKKLFLTAMLFLLASCTDQEITAAEHPRIIKEIEEVEFLSTHEEAEHLQDEDVITPEHVDFELEFLNSPKNNGVHENQIGLYIEVEEGEELLLGSTHFRLEYYNGDEWEQIENVPYGAEDAQVIVTSEEPFQYTFYEIDQFETDLDTGIYRFVNSGYTFPFYVYVLDESGT